MARFFNLILIACVVPMSIWAKPVIDVVIPCAKKDAETLNLCIEGVKAFVKDVRRVIVVSKEAYTTQAEWFNESQYPFTLTDMGKEIFPESPEKAFWFASEAPRRGWIYQQLLKFYAPIVIPDIASNVLIVDSDVIFLRPVEFFNAAGEPLYAYGSERHRPYFQHMHCLVPGLRRWAPALSGICHHMLFQKQVIRDLFSHIESVHGKAVWRALCGCIDTSHIDRSCLSEYEIYFNYIFLSGYPAQIRPLRWANGGDYSLTVQAAHEREGFDYVAYHAYNREDQ